VQFVAKPVPIANRLNAGDPTIAEVGLSEVITGVAVGVATVRVAVVETLYAGAGFTAVTFSLPAAETSEAGKTKLT
jgi:hypothetical protein